MTLDVSATNTGTPDALAALVEACNQAFSRGTCSLGEAHAQAVAPDRTVVVEWSDERTVRVRLVRSHGETEDAARDLEFQPSDSLVERWRSVGYVAGTLADESLAAQARITPHAPNPPAKTSPSPKSERTAPPPNSPARALPHTWIDADFGAGPALRVWRLGGLLRGGHLLAGPWFVTLATRYSRQSVRVAAVPLTLQWFTPSIGMGWRENLPPLELNLRSEGFYELTRASAREDQNNASARRSALGVLLGLDLVLQFSDWGALTLGGELAYTGRPIDVRIHDATGGTLSSVGGSVLAGFRTTFR